MYLDECLKPQIDSGWIVECVKINAASYPSENSLYRNFYGVNSGIFPQVLHKHETCTQRQNLSTYSEAQRTHKKDC